MRKRRRRIRCQVVGTPQQPRHCHSRRIRAKRFRRIPQRVSETSAFLYELSSLQQPKCFTADQPGRNAHLRHPLEHLAKGIALTESFLPRPAERRSIGNLFLDAELAKLPGQIHLALSASLSSAKGVWLLKT